MSDLPFDPAHAPQHVAIIMDGNGRWARERGKDRASGHKAGAENIREILTACGDWGVAYLTLYAFSTENWNRPKAEVFALMQLLKRFLKKEEPELARKNVRLQAIGDLDRLPNDARRQLTRSMDALAGNTGVTMTLALSYGARDEIIRAVRQLAREVQEGIREVTSISEEELSGHLDTAGTPDPDLLIRTAGEMRLSNFLLWQLSYAEYYATSVTWPDFSRGEFAQALAAYQLRTRKFGHVVE